MCVAVWPVFAGDAVHLGHADCRYRALCRAFVIASICVLDVGVLSNSKAEMQSNKL